MKPYKQISAYLLIVLALVCSFKAAMPSYTPDLQTPPNEFSTDRALQHVKAISQTPHGVGFSAHEQVREYLIDQLALLGLNPILQEGYTAGDWANYSKAVNILARIKGNGKGKALLLLSHYDSSPHSSLGASDAGSGVATILEGIRAFLAEGEQPANDIIILFSDAEELGLNGADLFVNNHPWAKEVGLVLNFEARGSGGPSYMLMETNQGNSSLIEAFEKADVPYPVANSLTYSVYKMLPNDTDLTVFREDADIPGFNFAFIDDHFDYHTQLDNYARLDRNTLAHQGSYLMPLLNTLSKTNLENRNSNSDKVYFNIPFYKLVTYPYSWIFPMLVLASLAFIYILFSGFKRGLLSLKGIAKGFLPVVAILILAIVIGLYTWPILLWFYPAYQDILHGFPYNGHIYIGAIVCLCLTLCFALYAPVKNNSIPNLLIAPILLWLGICWAAAFYLPGASFFTISLFALLASCIMYLHQKKIRPLVLIILSLPAIWIYGPFIYMFPVGLGLKLLVTATVLTALSFLLLLPLFALDRYKSKMSLLFLILGLGCIFQAHWQSNFKPDRAKPNSLIYMMDLDEEKAIWATYDQVLGPWNKPYFSHAYKPTSKTFASKYKTPLHLMADAPIKDIAPPITSIQKDSVHGNMRYLTLLVEHQRPVNRLEIFADIPLAKAKINGIALSKDFLIARKAGRLVTHYISDNDPTFLELELEAGIPISLKFYESSNDLLTHPSFNIPERPNNTIPMPFVLNDAIVLSYELTL